MDAPKRPQKFGRLKGRDAKKKRKKGLKASPSRGNVLAYSRGFRKREDRSPARRDVSKLMGKRER